MVFIILQLGGSDCCPRIYYLYESEGNGTRDPEHFSLNNVYLGVCRSYDRFTGCIPNFDPSPVSCTFRTEDHEVLVASRIGGKSVIHSIGVLWRSNTSFTLSLVFCV